MTFGRETDPLDVWFEALDPVEGRAEGRAWRVSERRQQLAELAAALRDEAQGGSLPRLWLTQGVPYALSDADRCQAETLCRQVRLRGGAGSRNAEEQLLNLLGEAGSEDSVPFWEECLAWKRPRDRFAGGRRRLALAGMAQAVRLHDVPTALVAIEGRCVDPDPTVRAEAVWLLGRAFLASGRALPDAVAARCRAVALEERAFAPRFLARRLLSLAGLEVPANTPGGAYGFDVRLAGTASFSCSIELRSEQELADLHLAIMDGFDWDDDHLYELHLNSQGSGDPRFLGRDTVHGPFDDGSSDRASWPELTLGQVGFAAGQVFSYLFDFGDRHWFSIRVTGVMDRAAPGDYPHIARHGIAPEQYPSW